RIIDPAGGSWCLDALTGELAACAWQRLAELDAAGGMAEALRSGLLAERLAATRRARETLLRTRARPVLGVSAYPAPVGEAVVAEGSSGMLPSRFVPQGDAAPFERLRDAADGWAAARGGRPRLVLRLLGEPRTAGSAAGLARSVGEAGGLEVVVGEAEPGAALALCLGRGVVPTELTAAIEQGHDGRAAFVLVATGTNEDAPPSDATAAWLRPESDVVTLLEQLHRALGVLP
ncbi:MAG: acyl-CoA mutase large subunit family protein, partial [Gemmatimonadales bacterium]|nr:acyl-CoA mutase large subunit family protein [Gemmatimonadales bacterium]